MSEPLVTVLLLVYNGEKYLAECLESILAQTYRNFEFIIVDDCSTDRSLSILQEFNDERITLIKNDRNRGTAFGAKTVLDRARGKYVARMDQDDVALPGRFAAQVEFLEKNLEVALLGTWNEVIDENGARLDVSCPPAAGEPLRKLLRQTMGLCHPSIMYRTEALRAVGGYSFDKAVRGSRDLDLWLRMADKYEIANLPEIFTRYRLHPDQSTSKGLMQAMRSTDSILSRRARTAAQAGESEAVADYREGIRHLRKVLGHRAYNLCRRAWREGRYTDSLYWFWSTISVSRSFKIVGSQLPQYFSKRWERITDLARSGR